MKQLSKQKEERKEKNNMTCNFVRVPSTDCLISALPAERLDEMSFQLKGDKEE